MNKRERDAEFGIALVAWTPLAESASKPFVAYERGLVVAIQGRVFRIAHCKIEAIRSNLYGTPAPLEVHCRDSLITLFEGGEWPEERLLLSTILSRIIAKKVLDENGAGTLHQNFLDKSANQQGHCDFIHYSRDGITVPPTTYAWDDVVEYGRNVPGLLYLHTFEPDHCYQRKGGLFLTVNFDQHLPLKNGLPDSEDDIRFMRTYAFYDRDLNLLPHVFIIEQYSGIHLFHRCTWDWLGIELHNAGVRLNESLPHRG